MFTGIVQGQAEVISITGDQTLKHFRFRFPTGCLEQIQHGASIAINGTCLTVTDFDLALNIAEFDAIEATLLLTNLGALNTGDLVNFERAAKIGDEIGGHLMSGHIFSSIVLSDIHKTPTNCTLFLQLTDAIKPYILAKGYVGLNGCSLTIGEVLEDTFTVHLIPETLSITTFGRAVVGDLINLELDSQTQTIVDTVKRYLSQQN